MPYYSSRVILTNPNPNLDKNLWCSQIFFVTSDQASFIVLLLSLGFLWPLFGAAINNNLSHYYTKSTKTAVRFKYSLIQYKLNYQQQQQ
jgi:hypothetical protein